MPEAQLKYHSLREYIINEPSWLYRIFGSSSPVISQATIAEGSPVEPPNERIAPQEIFRIDWIAEEIALIQKDPENYDKYIPFFNYLQISTILVCLYWLKSNVPDTYEQVMKEINQERTEDASSLKYRIRRANQQLTLSDVLNQDTIAIIKDCLT